MDKNGDGKVRENEVFEFLNCMIKDNTTDQIVGAFVKIILKVIDVNRDGKISKEEFINYLNLNPRNVVKDPAACFAKLDLNSNGFITEDELQIVFREFYTSTDPNAPGNVLYGQID